MRTSLLRRSARCVVCSAAALWLAHEALASDTTLVSISINGTASGPNTVTGNASISDDGRYVAFSSNSSSLVPGMLFAAQTHVYVRDQVLGTTTRIGPAIPENGLPSRFPVISSDGTTVVFETANSLVASDVNGEVDVYAYTIGNAAIECVSVDSTGTPGGGRIYVEGQGASQGVVSGNGNFVAFQSIAQLSVSDTNIFSDIYVRDRSNAFTRLESVTAGGLAGNGDSTAPALSASSEYLVFSTVATDLAGASTAGIYRKDRVSGTMQRVDVDGAAQTFNGTVTRNYALSGDGRFVALTVSGLNPAFGDLTGFSDVFVSDLATQSITRVSFASNGGPTNGHCREPDISADGRYVSFISEGNNLVVSDLTGLGVGGADVILRDRLTNRNALISVSDSLAQGVSLSNSQFALDQSMSSDGRRFAMSTYQRLDPTLDTVVSADAYSRDRLGFASFPAGKAGASGFITLSGTGSVSPGGSGSIVLNNAVPNAAGFVFVSLDDHKIVPASGQLKNATLITVTPLLIVPFVTSSGGGFNLPYTLPNLPVVPAIYLQTFVQDFSVVGAVAVSQGLQMAF